MKAVRRLVVAATVFAVGVWCGGCPLVRRPVTLTSLSPDDRWRVTLTEFVAPLQIDRNFDVSLDDLTTGQTRTVFRSPDEGRPVGSERVVWAADGSRFLLLGRHFYTHDAVKSADGELAYLMVEVGTGRTWCNARQQSDHPGFTAADLRAVRWAGWVPAD